LSNNKTLDYVDGIAIHWYMGMVAPPTMMVQTHKNYPDLFMLSTEACNGFEEDSPATSLGSWKRGEFYSTDIMEVRRAPHTNTSLIFFSQDLLNWVGGWIDWNMALDETGGPTYISNFVDSPIIVNASANEFYKQPMFYHLGHFSKFIPPDSVHIAAESNFDGDVLVLACKRPDGTIVVVILNK
jgi:glucosylceramidase